MVDEKAKSALRELTPENAEELLGRVALRGGDIRNTSAYMSKASKRIAAEAQQGLDGPEEVWQDEDKIEA